jgi:hypothetical protein
MRILLFASAICAATVGMASSPCCEPCECALKAVPFSPSNGYGVGVSGDFLYWLPNIDNVESVMKFVGANPSTVYVQELNFKYHPGFRISADIHSDCKGVFLQASWTSFHPNASRNLVAGPDDTLISLYGHAVGLVGAFTIADANQRWELKYDMVDLFLEPPAFSYKSFSFNPFVGLRGGRIDQPIQIEFPGFFLDLVTPAVSTIDIRQKFWCAGVTAGLNTGWDIGAGFSFFGDFLVSLVYGHFNLSETYFLEVPSTAATFTGSYKDHFNRFRPNLQTAFGFEWDYSFCQYALSLSAAYEMVVWFNQNQLIANTVDSGLGGFAARPTRFNGDLGMGGLTLSAGFEF